MSEYVDILRKRHSHGLAHWDLSEPRTRRELKHLRFEIWYHSGPRTVVFGTCGALFGTGLGYLIGAIFFGAM